MKGLRIWTSVVVGLVGLIAGAWAQSVSIDEQEISLDAATIQKAIDLFGAVCPSFSMKSDDGLASVTLTGCGSHLMLGDHSTGGSLELTDDDSQGHLVTVNLSGLYGAIYLGSDSEDGDIILMDSSPVQTSIAMDGQTGNATNQLDGNGFVKGWARINSDGTVLSCWRCDPDPSKTFRSSAGIYNVSFAGIASDIRSRPKAATLDSHDPSGQVLTFICVSEGFNNSSVLVKTTDHVSADFSDRAFNVFVY